MSDVIDAIISDLKTHGPIYGAIKDVNFFSDKERIKITPIKEAEEQARKRLPKMTDKHTAKRRRLGDVREGLTMKTEACGFKYYVTVNFFDDDKPAEIFIRIAKEGSSVAGFVEALAITISIALQYGVPWEILHGKYLNQIFEPRDDKNSSLVHAIGNTITELIEKRNA